MFNRFYLFVSLLLIGPSSAFAQPPCYLFADQPLAENPDTLFYPYYDDVQMIEIDHLGYWMRQKAYSDMEPPRSSSWEMYNPAPLCNVYLFRHHNGSIVKAFNTSATLDSLTRAFRTVPAGKKSTGTPHIQRYRAHRYGYGTIGYAQEKNDFGGYYLVHTGNAPFYNRAVESLRSMQEPKLGLIDSFGNFFLPMEYSEIASFGDKILLAKDGQCGMTDYAKNAFVPMEYDTYSRTSMDDLVFLREGKIMLIYSLRREKLLPVDGFDYIAFNDLFYDMNNASIGKSPGLYTFRKEGKTGLLDTNYTVVTPAVYDFISWFREDRAVCCRNNKFGYLDAKGKEVIPCIYTYAEYFDAQTGVVQYEGKFRNVDKQGRLLDTLLRNHAAWNYNLSPMYGTICGLKIVHTSTGCGLAKAGDVFVVPAIYTRITQLLIAENGRTVYSPDIFIAQRFDKFGVVDTSGRVLLPFEYSYIEDRPNANGCRIVKRDDNHMGIINSRYELVVPCIYQSIGWGYEGENFYRAWKEDKTGAIDTAGRTVIPLVYGQLNLFRNGRALARKDSLYGFIDKKGNVLIPFAYSQAFPEFENGLCAVKLHGKWGFIDTTGRMVIAPQYDEVRRFESTITGVKLNGRWGFIDRKGKLVVDYRYDVVGYPWYADGTCEVTREGKVGLINAKGKEVVACVYTRNCGFSRERGHCFEKDGVQTWVKVK